MKNGKPQLGFTYLMALVFVAVLGAALAAAGELWSIKAQREKELELLWVGNQFRQAIGVYYHRSGGAARRFPPTLQDLVEDKRSLVPQRYLRKIYPDPMTGTTEWDLVAAPDGGIMGVRSRSKAKPLRTVGSDAPTYEGWVFIYEPFVPPARR